MGSGGSALARSFGGPIPCVSIRGGGPLRRPRPRERRREMHNHVFGCTIQGSQSQYPVPSAVRQKIVPSGMMPTPAPDCTWAIGAGMGEAVVCGWPARFCSGTSALNANQQGALADHTAKGMSIRSPPFILSTSQRFAIAVTETRCDATRLSLSSQRDASGPDCGDPGGRGGAGICRAF